jgi:hypothetical protein
MSALPDPLPPGEVASDELSPGEVLAVIKQAFSRVAPAPVAEREPVCGLPTARPEFVLTDCQFEARVRGLLMVITVREVLTVSPERTIRLRVSKAWLRNLVARAQRMGL